MIITYNSLRKSVLSCSAGTFLLFIFVIFHYFNSGVDVIFWLFVICLCVCLLGTWIYLFKNPFVLIDVKIDTEKRLIYLNNNQIIPFAQINSVKFRVATGRFAGGDWIEFYTTDGLLFAIPINSKEVKELEKFFNLTYIGQYDIPPIANKPEHKEKIKKMYALGLIGRVSPLISIIIFILFIILNFPIMVFFAKFIYDLGFSKEVISTAVSLEIVLFMGIIWFLYKNTCR